MRNLNILQKLSSDTSMSVKTFEIKLDEIKPDLLEPVSEAILEENSPKLSFINQTMNDTARFSLSESIKNYDFTPEQEFDESDPIYSNPVINNNCGVVDQGRGNTLL